MNNHIIVGEGRKCMCGVYSGRAVGCAELLGIAYRIQDHAKAQMNPLVHTPPPLPKPEDLLLLVEAIQDCVVDCA